MRSQKNAWQRMHLGRRDREQRIRHGADDERPLASVTVAQVPEQRRADERADEDR